jgi:hypothetical protein
MWKDRLSEGATVEPGAVRWRMPRSPMDEMQATTFRGSRRIACGPGFEEGE